MAASTASSKLDGIFCPKSIAVVGASSRPGTVGSDLFHNLLLSDFHGSVYPINPKASNIMGVHAYATLGDVPGPVDLAVLILPAAAVLPTIDQAIAKQVRGLVVISAGFKEVGPEGAELEGPGLRESPLGGDPADWSQLPGRDQHARRRADERHLRPQNAVGRQPGLHVAKRGPVHLGVGLRRGAAHGLQQVRQLRQQGRRERDRPAGLPGRRPGDRGDRHVRGGREQRPAVHRDGAADLLGDAQTDAVFEVGPLSRRGQGRQQPYGLAGRLRFALRRPAGPERRAARGHDRRVVRLRRAVHHAALAEGEPAGGDHHQRGRAGHHGHRCGSAARLEAGRVDRGDQRQAAGGLARGGLAPQPSRRDRRRPLRPLQGRHPHRAGRPRRGHGRGDPHAAVDDRDRRDGRGRARGRQRHRQTRGLRIHGGPRCGRRRGPAAGGGHPELSLPRGRRAGPGRRQPPGDAPGGAPSANGQDRRLRRGRREEDHHRGAG